MPVPNMRHSFSELVLAPRHPRDQPPEQGNDDADHDACAQREIKREVVSLDQDVAGQSPDPDLWESTGEPNQSANDDEHRPGDDQRLSYGCDTKLHPLIEFFPGR